TQTYPLSLHDALPISPEIRQNTEPGRNIVQKLPYALRRQLCLLGGDPLQSADHQETFRSIELNGVHLSCSHGATVVASPTADYRSEEHTSELQSRFDL